MARAPSRPPRREIPPERKVAYYGGMALIAVGIVVFASTFFSMPDVFGSDSPDVGDPDFWSRSKARHRDFEQQGKASMFRSLIGMGLIVLGSLVRHVGARGLSGSGVILDPEQAREDLEPWSRMGGGIVKDALSETGLGDRQPDVVVRCRDCKATNPESAKFCNQCGAEL